MKALTVFVLNLICAWVRLLGPGGPRGLLAENLILKQQLLVHSRSRKRLPNLTVADRFLFGCCSLFMSPRRLTKAAILIKPSTLLKFHTALIQKKYHRLYTSRSRRKPGPKGPSKELIDAVVAMKHRNPRFGCPRIAQQINVAFGLSIDKDVVRRILAAHYRPNCDGSGPSWLTALGHARDSLWSIDLFRCESIILQSYWVLVVMDQFTRRIIGFGVHRGDVNGPKLCRMFNRIVAKVNLPDRISTDNDPLFRFHRWRANLRILDIEEVKTVPHVPLSHPFVERLIGSIRRELLDQIFFWNSRDLETKLCAYQKYYNGFRVHSSLDGQTPVKSGDRKVVKIATYRWRNHCQGLYALPEAA